MLRSTRECLDANRRRNVKASAAVKLPAEYLERTIADMKPGETAWTVPWSMDVDRDGLCWISAATAPRATGGGTVTMKITRTEVGVECEFPATERYRMRGSRPADALPVVKITNIIPRL